MMKMERNKRIKLMALVVCLTLIGTVSAMIYSNSLSGNVELISQYPVALSWQGGVDLYEDTAFMDVTYSAVIVADNLGTEDLEIYWRITLTTPAGVDATMFTLKLDNIAVTFTGSAPDFEHVTASANGLSGLSSITKGISFVLNSAASPVLGTYTIAICAWVP